MSRYTKAHYEQLERIVCAAASEAAQAAPVDAWKEEATANTIRAKFAQRLAIAFGEDNPRFNADLWFKACGVQR